MVRYVGFSNSRCLCLDFRTLHNVEDAIIQYVHFSLHHFFNISLIQCSFFIDSLFSQLTVVIIIFCQLFCLRVPEFGFSILSKGSDNCKFDGKSSVVSRLRPQKRKTQYSIISSVL